MEALQKLMQQTLKNTRKTIGTSTIAQQGNFMYALNIRKAKMIPWIIHSRTLDHMIGDITVFDSYSSCQDHSTIRIVDDTLSRVVGRGLIVIT